MFKAKKIISVLLAAACTAGLATACQKNEDGGRTKISMLYMEGGGTPYREDWLILKELSEKKNVDLELQVVPGKDYAQKKSIVMASGEIPDILVNCWPSEMNAYAADGILLPVSDYVDKMPNYQKILKEWDLDDTIKDISAQDGKYYIMPDMHKNLGGSQCFGVREDIFKKHDIPLPTTYEELHQALKKLKGIYPESLGTGELYNGNFMMAFIAEAFNTNGGFSLPYGYCYDFDKNEWYFAPTSPQYKELLTFMNQMYQDGCLDPEAFTQDATQTSQKILNSKYFAFPINGPQEAKDQTKKLKEMGIEDAKVTALYPLAGPTGIRAVKPSSKNQGGVALPATIAKRKDFDKVLEFLDWLYYSEEAAILTTIGVEGVTYDKVDGKYQLKPEIKTVNNPDGTKALGVDYGLDQFGLVTLAKDLIPEEVKRLTKLPEQFEFEKYIIDNNMTTKDDPILKMSPEQNEQVKLLVTTLNDYTKQMNMKYMFGKESFDKWDNYVKECEQKGSTELIKIVNEAWKAQQAK